MVSYFISSAGMDASIGEVPKGAKENSFATAVLISVIAIPNLRAWADGVR